MICPECKSTSFREARQCPKHEGTPVCIDCCMACSYYNFGHGLTCMYYVRNPKTDYKAELEKVNRKIDYKMRQAEHFYSINRPRVAERIEMEIIKLIAERRSWEEKI